MNPNHIEDSYFVSKAIKTGNGSPYGIGMGIDYGLFSGGGNGFGEGTKFGDGFGGGDSYNNGNGCGYGDEELAGIGYYLE